MFQPVIHDLSIVDYTNLKSYHYPMCYNEIEMCFRREAWTICDLNKDIYDYGDAAIALEV